MDIDAVGTFTMCHAALKYLMKGGLGRGSSEGGGSIINISATLHYTAAWYQIHVSAAKAAVDALARNLALEWGTDYDIRVNGIAPGPIADTPGMSKLAPDEINSKARDYMPLFKLGEKWDIAMAALYLVSDAGEIREWNNDSSGWWTMAKQASPSTKRCSEAAFSSCGEAF
ncbi:unnamed protein product [Linum tenue]|uniref:2,4-dienoyl-CoA reductase [(3E)-enoyl-CoA-producing] n=1 Tax=Linum tenue TaxID=586396 RepID=A0AAV0RDC6_9ROSI|nr:unnamed protein product [Linum tenue]